MVPESLETGFGLTDTVAARIPAVVDAALAVLASWGVAGAATAAGSGPEHADA